MASLEVRAWRGVAGMGVGMAVILFLAAGTLDYGEAWLFLAVFLGASAAQTQYLLTHDRALLERRLKAGPLAEKERAQKIIMVGATIGFAALMVVPGLDRRFGWSHVAWPIVLMADVLILAGHAIIYRVFRENSFTAATIEVASEQEVIATGPYALVRHPMYAGGMLYLAAMPVALGSYWGLAAFAFMLPFLIWRIIDEERLLTRDLPGYADYKAHVRSRLVPGVW